MTVDGIEKLIIESKELAHTLHQEAVHSHFIMAHELDRQVGVVEESWHALNTALVALDSALYQAKQIPTDNQ